jgi:hypothetical protein
LAILRPLVSLFKAPIYTGTSSTKETTLGDVVKLKKRKK